MVESYANYDREMRYYKFLKIRAVLEDYKSLSLCDVLDIGTGSGYIASMLSDWCKSVTSVDITDERVARGGYRFIKVGDEKLPFKNGSFDIIISNEIIEHIHNQQEHLEEIRRVLKQDGICYLATPNKWWILDHHYRLPFVTYFSRKFSRFYVKILKNKEYDIYPLTYPQIIKFASIFSKINNVTPYIIKNPEKYHLDMFKLIQPLSKCIPLFILKRMNWAFPSFIFILEK